MPVVLGAGGPAAVPGFPPLSLAHRFTLSSSLGQGALSGSLISIAATPNAAVVGDVVLVLFCWATTGVALSTVSDTSGNTWNIVSTSAASSESGGYAWTTVTTGWADGANTVTGTLASGAPGGRCWTAAVIPALYSPVFDQHNEVNQVSGAPSFTLASSLAQVREEVLILDIVRTSPQGVPVWQWTGGFTRLNGASGVGTPGSGCAIGAFTNETGTAAVTGGFQGLNSADNHGGSIIAFKVTLPSSGTTFPITIIVGTVSLAATVIRLGQLNILPTVSTPVTLQRLGKLNILPTVSAAVLVVRKGLLNIITSTVTTPVTVAFLKVIQITINVTVGVTATVIRKALLNILPTISTPVTIQRLGKLIIKPTVTPTATDTRKGLINVTTGTVSTPVTVGRKGLLGVVAGAVSLPVTLVRKGLLIIKPTVAATASDTLIVTAAGQFGVPYMNLTVIGESSNSTRISTVG